MAALVLLAAAALAAPAGCGDAGSVRGRIVEVESDGVLSPRSVAVIDVDGRRWEFEVSDVFGHFTPAHLRQHMLSGEEVEVSYRREGSRLVAHGIEDSP